jgi:hypothetical protein
MQGFTFALPTVPTGQMSKQDQMDILLNQATATIVCCYLEHMNAAIAKGLTDPGDNSGGKAFFNRAALVNLIGKVKGALQAEGIKE